MSNLLESVNQFQEHGYLIVTNLLKTHKLYKKFLEYASKNKGVKYDPQVTNVQAFYSTKLCDDLQDTLHKEIEKWTGLELDKTYCYWRKYRKGNDLKPHTDRERCEISVSVCLGFDGDPWELYLLNKDGNPIRTFLNPGDALFYKGCERIHWRPKLKDNKNHIQAFLHFVDKNGPWKDLKGDPDNEYMQKENEEQK